MANAAKFKFTRLCIFDADDFEHISPRAQRHAVARSSAMSPGPYMILQRLHGGARRFGE